MFNKYYFTFLFLFVFAASLLFSNKDSQKLVFDSADKIGKDIRYQSQLFISTLLDSIKIFNKPRINLKIIIDPGHGGIDTGTIRGGVLEKDLNLVLAKKLKSYLEEHGAQVILTRENDRFVSLKQRVNIANSVKPDLFISVHANSSPDETVRGSEIYWNTIQSKNLAHKIKYGFFHADGIRFTRGLFRASYYVIRNIKAPSVLVETGYLTNDEERYTLTNSNDQEKVITAIGYGVLKYSESLDKISDRKD